MSAAPGDPGRWRPSGGRRRAARRLDDALAARASGARHEELAAAFGRDAARLATFAGRLRRGAPPPPAPDAAFLERLSVDVRRTHAEGIGRARASARPPGSAARRAAWHGRVLSAAALAASVVLGIALAPSGTASAMHGADAPVAAAARTPDAQAGPTPIVHAAAHAPRGVAPPSIARHPDAAATRPAHRAR